MFGISFTELMLIGAIALVVIGPERLPRVARMVGHLLGRAQRYVSDVKGDIQREMNLDQMSELKDQMEEAARSVKTSVTKATDTLRDPLEEARKALKETSESVEDLVKTTRTELDQISNTTTDTASTAPQPDAALDTDMPVPADHVALGDNTPSDAQKPGRALTDTELADIRLTQSASQDADPATHDTKPGTPL